LRSAGRERDPLAAAEEQSSRSRVVRDAGIVFAAALIVRLLHLAAIRRAPFFTILLGDSHGYDEWARSVAGGDWIGHEVFYQAPLYPYFLGAIYTIAGRHLLLVRVVQAIIGSASCVFLGLAARRLVSPGAGLLAGLMLALYAPAIFFDTLIQKSVLDVFFVCLTLYLISRIVGFSLKPDVRMKVDTDSARQRDQRVRSGGRVQLQPDQRVRSGGSVRLPAFDSLRRGSPDGQMRFWLALGLAIGGLSLTRENAIVLAAVIAVWAVAHRPRAAAAFIAAVAIVVLPVAIRNSVVGGGFYVTTSQFGPNFYIGNNAQADGSYQPLRAGRGTPEYERQDATELAERALGRKLSPADVSSYWTGRALEFITARPARWLELVGRKAVLLLNRTEMVDTESQESHADWSPVLRIASIVGHFGVLVPLATLGMIAMWPERKRWSILYALAAAYAVSVVLFYVFARYRYPLVPLLVVFAAAGLMQAAAGWRAAVQSRRASWTIAAVGAVAVLSNWPLLSASMNRAVTEQNLGAALQAARLGDAIAHYRRAIELKPDYAPAYNNLGSALRANRQPDAAIAAYRRALELRPDFPDAQYNLANALLDEGRSGEAAQHLRKAMQAVAPSADAHNNLGIALAAEGRRDDAIAEFRKTLDLEPDSIIAHRNLGNQLVTAGATREGVDHLRRAAQLAPGDAAIQYDLGSALLEAGELDDAVTVLRAAIRLEPGSARAHNNLGIALGSQRRLTEAIAEFQTALKLKPDFEDAQRNLAMALQARPR